MFASTALTAALITVPAGETAKSLNTVQACYDQLAAQRLEREHDVVEAAREYKELFRAEMGDSFHASPAFGAGGVAGGGGGAGDGIF